jgi:hypothetical protein
MRARPPTAPIVSIDVMDDNGMAMTSDVIAAADWILANKSRYNIRVANFSLQSTVPGSFMYDPLDKAVEKLWFSGVVVVTAAGNYGVDGLATTVAYAPANDPFVISVGASDTNNTGWTSSDDTAAPWSAFGYTLDGFAKPDIGAPGRYLIGPVPSLSTMPLEHPERVTSPGYMWMSGTSFSAPVVSGAAALILAKNPGWTPDKVKGALLLSARPTAAGMALGVGEVNAKRAFDVTSPPNPNAGLNQFVGRTAPAAVAFDSASWRAGARPTHLEPGCGIRPPGQRLVGERFLEPSLLGQRLLGAGELGLGLLERGQLGAGLLGRGLLERGQLGSRLVGGLADARSLVPRKGEFGASPAKGGGSVRFRRIPSGLASTSLALRPSAGEEWNSRLMRLDRTHRAGTRQSALWGKPRGETRSSALWGKPGRGFAFLAIVAALAAPVAATAGSNDRSVHSSGALVPAGLMAEAQAHPNQLFSVIVQGKPGAKTSLVADAVVDSTSKGPGGRRA